MSERQASSIKGVLLNYTGTRAKRLVIPRAAMVSVGGIGANWSKSAIELFEGYNSAKAVAQYQFGMNMSVRILTAEPHKLNIVLPPDCLDAPSPKGLRYKVSFSQILKRFDLRFDFKILKLIKFCCQLCFLHFI